jgi:hypothetical protein
MKILLKQTICFALQKLSSIFFPPVCLHCEEEMKNNRFLFCKSCQELLTLCNLPKGVCQGWLFEKIGPAKTLYSSFKRGSQVVFSKTLASYIVVQMDRMSWPIPDGLIRAPGKKSSAMRDLMRELSSLLGRKMVFFPKKGGVYLLVSEEMNDELLQQIAKEMPEVKLYGMGIFSKDVS